MNRPNVYREFIVDLCRLLKPDTYVEIGIQQGALFFEVAPHVKHAIGVDINDGHWANPGNAEYHAVSSDKFFVGWPGNADIIFIDADHSANQVESDTWNALSRLNENGIVLLHDTWPMDESFTAPQLSGTAYQAMKPFIKHKSLDVLTMPFMHGLTLINRRPSWHE